MAGHLGFNLFLLIYTRVFTIPNCYKFIQFNISIKIYINPNNSKLGIFIPHRKLIKQVYLFKKKPLAIRKVYELSLVFFLYD